MADFKYLDSWIDDSIKDMKTRKAQTWVTYNKLGKICNYILCTRELKVELLLATVESVFLYGNETWTLTKSTEKQNDGAILECFAQH